MTRVVPEGGAQISGEYIPGGVSFAFARIRCMRAPYHISAITQTVVAISNIFVHWNEDIFPDHLAFKPERWLGPQEDSLDHWLVAFSKGPRSCLGIK